MNYQYILKTVIDVLNGVVILSVGVAAYEQKWWGIIVASAAALVSVVLSSKMRGVQ